MIDLVLRSLLVHFHHELGLGELNLGVGAQKEALALSLNSGETETVISRQLKLSLK